MGGWPCLRGRNCRLPLARASCGGCRAASADTPRRDAVGRILEASGDESECACDSPRGFLSAIERDCAGTPLRDPGYCPAPGRDLGMPADFWLGLQQDWDLWHAMNGPGADEINRLEPILHSSGTVCSRSGKACFRCFDSNRFNSAHQLIAG